MNDSNLDVLARALSDGLSSRRGMMQGLAGLAAGPAGFSQFDLGDTDGKKRKKKGKNKRRKKKGKGGNDGGGGGGGGGECNQTLCEGQCVDLDNDNDNCGACGNRCAPDATCTEGQCVIAFGRGGSGDGEFAAPTGLALTQDGSIQVADFTNARIVNASAREFLGAFGERGDEDGRFLNPFAVAVNLTNGDIYVTDAARHCIQRFSSEGVFEATFGFFGSGREQLNTPRGVAIDQVSGNVYVTDTGNNQLKELNANLFALGEIRLVDGPGRFANPQGIAVDGDRNLVVADTGNDRIVIVDRDGNFIRAFGQTGSGNGELDSPVAVALDAEGNIYVVDKSNDRVQQFTADGQVLRAFGSRGNAIGQFDNPFGIAVDRAGTIIVTDTNNNRVQFFFPPLTATQRGGKRHRAKRSSR